MMTTLQIDKLNPRVKRIIATALRKARPFWFGITSNGREIWWRQPVYMIETAPHLYYNANAVQWMNEGNGVLVDGCLFAMTKQATPFNWGSMRYPHTVCCGDTLLCAEGSIEFIGHLPEPERD